jgi:hypothetical protein
LNTPQSILLYYSFRDHKKRTATVVWTNSWLVEKRGL